MHNYQLLVKRSVEQRANDFVMDSPHVGGMAKRTLSNPLGVPQIYGKRQPKRPHELRAWVEKRGYKTDAAFAKDIGADKSVVSKWLDVDNPTTPGVEWQAKLGVFFGDEEDPADIFRHPDEDWMARKLRGKTDEQVERMKQLLDAAFPDERKAAKR